MYPWRFYLDRSIHFFTSRNRHGTHSPFVYGLLDEVVYPIRRSGEPKDKVHRLVARLKGCFGPDCLYELNVKDQLFPESNLAASLESETEVHQLGALWPQLHPGSVLVLHGIYRDAGMKRQWYSLRDKQEVTVTMDLFHVGLVFFHSGQAKEHFRIRF